MQNFSILHHILLKQEKVKRLLDFYKSIYPLIVLAVYAAGFMYLFVYYQCFDVPIIHYVTFSDILLYAVTMLIFLAIVLRIMDMPYLIIRRLIWHYDNRRNLNKEDTPYTLGEEIGAFSISFFLYILSFFVITNIGIASLLIIYVIIRGYLIFRKETLKKENKSAESYDTIFVIILSCIMLTYSTIMGVKDAYSMKNEGANRNIEIECIDTTYSTITNKHIRYIGETSSTIFLYNLQDTTTLALSRNSVKQVKIYDTLRKIEHKTNLMLEQFLRPTASSR